MKTRCVVLNNQVIHVGEWDHWRQEVIDDELVMLENPMPEGAIAGDFDIEMAANGRIVLAMDYQALRAAEYPRLGDQLDALFKAGLFPPDMAALVQAVKDKYPKG